MRLAAALIAAVTVLTGCASSVDGTPPGRPGTRGGQVALPPPDQLVFQVETGGGYVPFEYFATARPWLSVYGDGSVYLIADRDSRPPGTPVELERAAVPVDVLGRLLSKATDTGLFGPGKLDLGDPGITDSASTRVTFRPGSAPARSVSAYALDYTDGDDNLSGEEREGRRVLRKLIDTYEDAVVRDTTATWSPDRVDVTELKIQTRTSNPKPWPGPALDTVLRGTGNGRCGVIAGPAAARVFETAVEQGTLLWSEGAVVRPLAIRALLPGERGCER